MAENFLNETRWGTGDQIGAANLNTPESRLAALELVSSGEIFDLSHTISEGAPVVGPHQTSYSLQTKTYPEDGIANRRKAGATNDAGAIMEHIELSVHVGTHIDALGHFTIGDRMYGGFKSSETITGHGLAHLGIDHMPPLITRGVFIDMSTLDGGDYLEGGRAITAQDLHGATDDAGIEIEAGDVVCIRTGWGRFYETDPVRYAATEPGLDTGAAHWLTDRDICAVGSDNMAIEVTPGVDHPRIQYPVHQHFLVESGVYMIENMMLDQLAHDGVNVFCFILAAVKLKNATGVPVRPIALI
ncbi:MAG: cyclase family protein [Rhodospirillales bacterium]|nr:cyclase family protein [Rhodospirillales bacterium]